MESRGGRREGKDLPPGKSLDQESLLRMEKVYATRLHAWECRKREILTCRTKNLELVLAACVHFNNHISTSFILSYTQYLLGIKLLRRLG